MKILLLFSIIIGICTLNNPLFGKVTPPNYDFSLDTFANFMPGQKREQIDQKYPKNEIIFQEGDFLTKKYMIAQIHYVFPIFVQYNQDTVVDFHTRLPHYFLHDVFHQSLINRIGKQDLYSQKREHALYIWKNKNNLNYVYAATCTITCFPIYYAVYTKEDQVGGGYTPIIKKLSAVVEKADDNKKK